MPTTWCHRSYQFSLIFTQTSAHFFSIIFPIFITFYNFIPLERENGKRQCSWFLKTFGLNNKNFHVICTLAQLWLDYWKFLRHLAVPAQVSYKGVSNNKGVSQIIFCNCDESNLSILPHVKCQNLDYNYKGSEIFDYMYLTWHLFACPLFSPNFVDKLYKGRLICWFCPEKRPLTPTPFLRNINLWSISWLPYPGKMGLSQNMLQAAFLWRLNIINTYYIKVEHNTYYIKVEHNLYLSHIFWV